MHDDDPDDVVHNLFAEPGLRRHAAGPADRRDGDVDLVDVARPDLAVLQAALLRAQHGRRGRRQPRPRDRAYAASARRSPATASSTTPPPPASAAVRRGPAAVSPARLAARRPFEQVNVVLGVNGVTRGRRPQRTRWACSTPPSAAVRPRACSRRSARARPGLLGLLLRLPPRRRRPGRGLGRLPAGQARRRAGGGTGRARQGRAPTASPTRSSSAARASSAAAWSSASRTPAPGCPASARASSSPTSCSPSTRSSPASTPSPSTTSAPRQGPLLPARDPRHRRSVGLGNRL